MSTNLQLNAAMSGTAQYIQDAAGPTNSSLAVSTGNTGILTTSPGDALEIHGGSKNFALSPNDAYPTLQILNYDHDNVSINFDSYYRSAWYSSNSSANFRIYKEGGLLRFSYASGVAQGSSISAWTGGGSENNNCAMVIDSSGRIGIGTTSPVTGTGAALTVNSAIISQKYAFTDSNGWTTYMYSPADGQIAFHCKGSDGLTLSASAITLGQPTGVNVTISWGAGTPNNTVSAPPGSLYLNTNGGAGTTLYVKESGTGNTGWVGK